MKILCLDGYRKFCYYDNYEWALLTFGIFVITIPFALIENLRKFVYINSLGIAINGLFAIITFFTLASESNFLEKRGELKVFNYQNFLKLYGVALYSLESVPLLLPLKNKMREQTKFTSVFLSSSAFVVVITISISLSAYYVKKLF